MDKRNHLIIIGAQRAGSTMLYGILDQHPEVVMSKPVRPEPKYFLNNRGTYDHYFSSLFPDVRTAKWYGEKSTSYYEYPMVAQKIKGCIPNVKIVFIMRDPVERALSNYWFSKQNGLETRSLHEVFLEQAAEPKNKTEEISVNPFNYLGRGEYKKLIEPYIKLFGSQYFLPLLFEDIITNQSLEELWQFLSLEPIKFETNSKFLNQSKRDHSDNRIKQVLNEYFAEKNEDLANYLQKDLSGWEK